MGLQLPQKRLSAPPQRNQQQVPLEQILAVMGQNPYASAIDKIGPALSQALQIRAERRRQANAVTQLASAAGEQPPADVSGIDPGTYEKLLSIKTARAKGVEDAAQNQREEGRKNTDLTLKLLQAQSGYTGTDAAGNKTTYPGMNISFKQGENGLPLLDLASFKPGMKPLPDKGGGTGANDPLTQLQNDLDPTSAKAGSPLNQLSLRSNSADRVLTLLDQSKNDPNLLQSREAAASVAALVQSGNSGRVAQEQLNHLTPSSLKGDIMAQVGYVFNQPVGLGQQEFFKSLRDTAVREKGTVQKQIHDVQVSRLGRHERTRQLFPATYNSILANYGLDAGKVKNGRYIEDQAASAPANESPDQRKARLLQELSGAQ